MKLKYLFKIYMSRFKMNFNSYQAPFQPVFNNGLAGVNMSVAPKTVAKPVSLSSPMIGRVHNVKPGCSACGKKVA